MVLVVALIPYGPLLALITVMGAAAWKGREKPVVKTGPDEAELARLQALYEALVPYFSVPEDPSPLFSHGGEWDKAFSEYEFDDDGRLTRLRVRYPAYFTDGEAESRARIEQLLHAKSGRGREYHFAWDEEGNQLVMSVLGALPTSIAAQRFVTSPGETVLGFTDAGRRAADRSGDRGRREPRRPAGGLAHRPALHRAPPPGRRPARHGHHDPAPLHRAPGPQGRRRADRRGQRNRRVRLPRRAARASSPSSAGSPGRSPPWSGPRTRPSAA